MKKYIITSLVLVFVFFIIGCTNETPKKEVKLTLPENNIELTVDDQYEIKPIVENLDNPLFNIESTRDIIEINDMTITALKVGTCSVVIILENNTAIRATLNITVKNKVPEQIKVESQVVLSIDETKQIEYEFEPANAVANVKYSSSDSSIVSVSNDGLMKANSIGTAIITITLDVENSNVKKEITVVVKENEVPVFVTNADYEKSNIINWGTTFDYKSGLTVNDTEDGNITDKVEVLNEVDTQEYGKHTIEYKVIDSYGNEATFSREVEVVWNYDVKFIGHQGSYYGVPNTEEAILNGITKLKYQCIEIDIKQTKDGVFVLSHDDTFGGKTIASTNWADLKDVVATATRTAGLPFQNGDAVEGATGSYSSTICTLERYLEICKQYNVTAVIELKSSKGISNNDQSRMPALMKVIEGADMLENVILLGSAYNCLIWTRNNGYDYIPCQYLVSSIESETALQRCIDYNLEISTNTTYGGSNSDEWIARYKEAGIKISTYTYTQYVDYPTVQEWIDKGVDYLTCDWQLMSKLNLPVSSNEPKVKYNVKFVDEDGTVLKESQVEQGKTASAPKVEDKNGYEFVGWDKDLKNIQEDTVFTVKYEPISYSITYVSNTDKVTEGSWSSKEEFVNELYSDLFNWIKSKGTSIDGLTISGSQYTFTRNSTTVTFSNVDELKALDLYDFEKTISNIMYKPVIRNSDGTCTIVEDNNYFLNSSEYRIKYQALDQWLYNCIKTNYSAYDTTYTPTSVGKIQIFFRMHQWVKGTSISGFNKLPVKYIVEKDTSVNAVLPTLPVSYTILDEISLPVATGNAKFLGWYDNPECTGEAITSISKGTTGNIVLYAKWEK